MDELWEKAESREGYWSEQYIQDGITADVPIEPETGCLAFRSRGSIEAALSLSLTFKLLTGGFIEAGPSRVFDFLTDMSQRDKFDTMFNLKEYRILERYSDDLERTE